MLITMLILKKTWYDKLKDVDEDFEKLIEVKEEERSQEKIEKADPTAELS